jgi:Xaa-Pro aminopeptidase
MAATVKNAGVGTRPRSIFRSVSTEIPAVDATATMLRAVIELKTPAEIETMRAAGRVVATTLATVKEAATAGTSLRELDALARAVIADGGARPSFLGYHPPFAPTPFPGVICTSVNDVIVHGIPADYRLADGDLLSVDCGAYLDGWHGDSAISFVVGNPEPANLRLIETTRQALTAGIEAAGRLPPGARPPRTTTRRLVTVHPVGCGAAPALRTRRATRPISTVRCGADG